MQSMQVNNRTISRRIWVTVRKGFAMNLPSPINGSVRWIFTAIVLTLNGCNGTPLFQLPDPAVRVIAFGDSSTDGPSAKQYTEFLQENPAIDAAAITNVGMGGETTTEGLPRLQQLLASGLFPNAEVVIIWEGGNDLIDFIQQRDPFIAVPPDSPLFIFGPQLDELLMQVRTNLSEMIAAARAAGATPILVTYYFIPEEPIDCRLTPLPTLLPAQAITANGYVERLNVLIRDLGTSEGVSVIDVALLDESLRADIANYFDCNHLSPAGNALAAAVLADAVIAELNN